MLCKIQQVPRTRVHLPVFCFVLFSFPKWNVKIDQLVERRWGTDWDVYFCEGLFLHETRWWGELEAAFSHPVKWSSPTSTAVEIQWEQRRRHSPFSPCTPRQTCVAEEPLNNFLTPSQAGFPMAALWKQLQDWENLGISFPIAFTQKSCYSWIKQVQKCY